MKYWKVTFSNGFAGCDEDFYLEAETRLEAECDGEDFIEEYGFRDPDSRFVDMDDEAEIEEYYNNVGCWVDEISKEEYDEATADYF